MIKAKFECVAVRKAKGWSGVKFVYEAEFSVVTSGSDEIRRSSQQHQAEILS